MNESNETRGLQGDKCYISRAKVTQAEGRASPTKWGWALNAKLRGVPYLIGDREPWEVFEQEYGF